jgi:GMP synthase-like glutamine amidotransferase
MRILCLRHAAFEGPGAVSQWARHRSHELIEVYPSRGAIDQSPFDMLIILGGPMGANDDAEYPWLAAERQFIASAVEDGKLVLGICLGAQLLAVALGGSVFPNSEPEIGWYPVTLTGMARRMPVFADWPDSFMVGHWHNDVFAPPDTAPMIAVSQACLRQGFTMDRGRVIGLQFHLEWTENTLMRLVEACKDELVEADHVQSAETILAHPELLGETRERLFSLLDRMEAIL